MSEAPTSIVGSPRKKVEEEEQIENEEKKKKRKLTSKVWDDLTKVKIKGDEKAKCNHCGTLLSLSTSSATTHLSRHLKSCAAHAAAKSGNQGSTRKFGRNTSVMPHNKVARTISFKDVIAVLERELQMSKSTLIFRFYDKMREQIPHPQQNEL